MWGNGISGWVNRGYVVTFVYYANNYYDTLGESSDISIKGKLKFPCHGWEFWNRTLHYPIEKKKFDIRYIWPSCG